VIVVVGNPGWRGAEPAGPAGRACDIAVEAARRGSRVELVGRTGDDPAGDALLLALTRAGVGHVAMLRDPSRATPIAVSGADDADDEQFLAGDGAFGDAVRTGGESRAVVGRAGGAGPTLDAADVSLGLGYLTAFAVLVVVDDVPVPILPVAAEAADYAGAHLVLLVAPEAAEHGVPPAGLPAAATVLAAPSATDDRAFAALVGAYAAALDGGDDPRAAFAAATKGAGWEALQPFG